MKQKQKSATKSAPAAAAHPAEPEPFRESWKPWAIAIAVAAVLFGGATLVALHRPLLGIEVHTFRWINDWPNSLRTLFLVLTMAPDSLLIALAAVLATFALKLYRLSWQLAAVSLGSAAAVFITKALVGRPRPAGLLPDVHVRAHESDMGFPSGHAAVVTAVALALFPYLPKGWRWLVIALIPIVSLSRLYLGVHLPLDVVGGFAIGLFVVSTMHLLPGKLKQWLRLD